MVVEGFQPLWYLLHDPMPTPMDPYGAKTYRQLRYNFWRENVNVGALFTLPILFFHLAVFHRKKNPPPPSPYQKSPFFQKLSTNPFCLDFIGILGLK